MASPEPRARERAAPPPVLTIRRYGPVATLIVVLALVAAAGVLAWRQYDDARSKALNEIRARVVLAQTIFEEYFKGQFAALDAIAVSPPVVAGDRPAMLAYLRRVAPNGSKTFTGGLGWIDAAGESQVSSSLTQLAPPVDVSDRSYFKAVVSTHKPFVSEGIVSRRAQQRVVTLAVPTYDAQGALNGVLAAGLVIAPTRTSRSSIDLGYAGLAILDRKGQSILNGFVHPRNQALEARLRSNPAGGALTDARGLDGRPGRVVVWASSPTADWTIVIDRPNSAVFAAATRGLELNLALIAGLALIALALLGWIARRARQVARRQLDSLAREHEIALRLQRSLLPATLPSIEGVDVAWRYHAAGLGLEVGGDWYDVVVSADGLVHAIVGDVAGRGLEAATLMGQLRNGFHAYAYDHVSPAEVLRRMLRLVPDGAMATAVCLTLDPFTRDLRYASAGHLPPLVLDGGTGTVTALDSGGAPPLGFVAAESLDDLRSILPEDATLVAYTDGLIERRTSDIDAGIARLSTALAAGAALGAVDLAGTILAKVGNAPTPGEDDIALLVVRLTGVPSRLEVELPANPVMLAGLRRRLRRWLTLRGLADADRDDAILAISEACNNSIEHAYDAGDGTIGIVVEHADGVLSVSVRDRGRWRMRSEPQPDRGRGLLIMRSIMQTVDVTADESGTTITLAKPLQR